jgi:hypothetical protein
MSGKRKWWRNVIKYWGGGIVLVVDDDVLIKQVGILARKTLVGKFLGRRVGMDSLNQSI